MQAPDTTSAELLERLAADRDAAVWNALVERHLPGLRWTVEVILGAGPDADDAVQESLLLIRDHAGRFVRRGDDDLDGQARRWILRVAANAALGLLRRRRRQERKLASLDAPQATQLAATPAGTIADAADLAPLRQAVADLPRTYQQAIVLRYFLGQEPMQMAAELGCSPGTVRVRLHRALGLLRRRLAPAAALALAGAVRLDAAEMLDGLQAIALEPPPAVGPSDLAQAGSLLASPVVPSLSTTAIFGGPSLMTVAACVLVPVLCLSAGAWAFTADGGSTAVIGSVAPASAAAPAVILPEPIAVATLPGDLRRALAAAGIAVTAAERETRSDGGSDYLLTSAPSGGQPGSRMRARLGSDGVTISIGTWTRVLPIPAPAPGGTDF